MAEKKQAYPQRVAPVLKDGSKYIKSTDLADLAKYNQSQTPAPKPTVQSVTNPGRFQMDTSNGILSSRGAGPDGGSGGGGGWEGPPVEGRVQAALRQALLPQAQAPSPAAPAAQPYRQEEGARVMSAPRGRVQTALAQNLLGDVNGGGYSAGIPGLQSSMLAITGQQGYATGEAHGVFSGAAVERIRDCGGIHGQFSSPF